MMIKNILTTIILLFTINAFAQTTMTVHTPSGATDYLLSDIDSITYNNGGGSSSNDTTVGGNGPAGGVVFYDKGTYSNGWRYLEVLTSDLNSSSWGCFQTGITGTSDLIGAGEANSNTIISQCTTPGIAAKVCLNYSNSNNGITYDDWFLPSIEELNLVYNFTVNNPTINLNITESRFWSSTQVDDDYAWALDTSNGGYAQILKFETSSTGQGTRPIRKF